VWLKQLEVYISVLLLIKNRLFVLIIHADIFMFCFYKKVWTNCSPVRACGVLAPNLSRGRFSISQI
jgi:hypothetical protein